MAQETVNRNQIHPDWGRGLYWLSKIQIQPDIKSMALEKKRLIDLIRLQLLPVRNLPTLHQMYAEGPEFAQALGRNIVQEEWRFALLQVKKCNDAGFGLRGVEILLGERFTLPTGTLKAFISEWWIKD